MPPNFIPLSKCTETESIERMCEGIWRAASIARQLAKSQNKKKWLQVANLLDVIRQKGEILASAKSLSRLDTLVLLDREKRKLDAQNSQYQVH